MFTSDKTTQTARYTYVMGAYLLATVACALFGAVYEQFSHGVFSYFMIYAFAFPLFGTVTFFLLRKAGKPFPGRFSADLLHAGITALTIGSIMRGILEIYGTNNPLILVYWVAGAALTAVGLFFTAIV